MVVFVVVCMWWVVVKGMYSVYKFVGCNYHGHVCAFHCNVQWNLDYPDRFGHSEYLNVLNKLIV